MHLGRSRTPPGMRLYAIGDVHGRADLLRLMHERIDAEIADDPPADWRMIHVGDYCDRGSDTKGVLDVLLRRVADIRVLALLGNHDAGFLNFLEEPLAHSLFVSHGGSETARSYGVEPDFGSEAGLWNTCHALNATIPQAHLAWLEALPRSLMFGDYFFCHAGIRPGIPIKAQDTEDLIWIRQEFLTATTLHQKVVVHGHTPRSHPEKLPNRINVDTGAWDSGILTAVVLEGAAVRFIDVRES